jgi:hypothetical protein
LEAEATRFWVAPRKWGKKKEKIQLWVTYNSRRICWFETGVAKMIDHHRKLLRQHHAPEMAKLKPLLDPSGTSPQVVVN